MKTGPANRRDTGYQDVVFQINSVLDGASGVAYFTGKVARGPVLI
jgi:hypothetical protein